MYRLAARDAPIADRHREGPTPAALSVCPPIIGPWSIVGQSCWASRPDARS